MLINEDLTSQIIGAAIEVHRALGPGLLESAYRRCLCHELSLRGLAYREEVPIPIKYKGMQLECGYRADLIVEDCVVVELKAVEALTGIHTAQLMTYLKLSAKKIGLLVNFNSHLLKDGIERVVL